MANATVRLSTAEWALLDAVRAWGLADSPGFWGRFAPEWGGRLRAAWESHRGEDAAGARHRLQDDHAGTARADLHRVHPSWAVRALQGESPAVRRAVASLVAPALSEALCAGLGLSVDEIEPDRPAHPDALQWALAFWPERLVGGAPPGPADPPAVLALTVLEKVVFQRLARAAALAKWAVALGPIDDDATSILPDHPALQGSDPERLTHFRGVVAGRDALWADRARRDVQGLLKGRSDDLVPLGLVTIGRLLAAVESQRARWALQHVAYQAAKFLRAHLEAARGEPEVVAFEGRLLRAAWDRLHAEGRLTFAWGEPPP